MNNWTYVRKVWWPSLKVIVQEWWAMRHEDDVPPGLLDSRGYVILGRRKVHVDALRECSVEDASRATGLTVVQLQAWARGPGFPLGLRWGQ